MWQLFDAVYKLECLSTQNVIAFGHMGELLDASIWEAEMRAQVLIEY